MPDAFQLTTPRGEQAPRPRAWTGRVPLRREAVEWESGWEANFSLQWPGGVQKRQRCSPRSRLPAIAAVCCSSSRRTSCFHGFFKYGPEGESSVHLNAGAGICLLGYCLPQWNVIGGRQGSCLPWSLLDSQSLEEGLTQGRHHCKR